MSIKIKSVTSKVNVLRRDNRESRDDSLSVFKTLDKSSSMTKAEHILLSKEGIEECSKLMEKKLQCLLGSLTLAFE